jgi:hypothetical protein
LRNAIIRNRILALQFLDDLGFTVEGGLGNGPPLNFDGHIGLILEIDGPEDLIEGVDSQLLDDFEVLGHDCF